MKNFLYSTMTSKEIYNIKKMFHQQSNNANIKMAFETLLYETEIAISNIKEVITSEEELRKLIVKLRAYDFSFAKDILGMSARGDNGSYYRDYLAMDGQNIIEVSFANHYETTKASRSKANNQSQFLFRVVLMTPKTKVKSDSIISPTSVVGNLKVLTNATIRCSSSIDEDLKMLLMSIHDYLISPSETYENAKPITKESKTYKNMKNNVQRINESQLRAIVAESVKNVLNERTYSPTDGQYAYQWSDKVRQARANDLGMKPDGRIEHYNDFNPFLSYTEYNKNDMERKRKAGNYNGNHAPSPRPSIYNAYLTIVHSGVDACVQYYGRTITAEAIKDLAEMWDGEKDDIEDDEI